MTKKPDPAIMENIEALLRAITAYGAGISNTIAEMTDHWDNIKDRIEKEEVTHEECGAMAKMLRRLHKYTRNADVGGTAIHVQMQNVRPDNINEGQKDCEGLPHCD